MKTYAHYPKKAFTLIELLIVIAIIGVLAVSLLPSILSGPSSARNVIRKKALVTMQAAIELYYDTTNSYPTTGWRREYDYPTNFIPNLVPDYLKVLPRDPLPRVGLPANCTTIAQSGYAYTSDGVNYKLIDRCAYEGAYPAAGEQFYDPPRPTYALMLCGGASATLAAACTTW